jgi:LPXTG-site transpeptidase (sortase) family protein
MVTEENQITRASFKKKKKRKGSFFYNLLTFIGIIGIIVGGYMVGNVLLTEYNRSQLTKQFTEDALKITENYIDKADFAPVDGDIVGMVIFTDHDVSAPIVEGTDLDLLHAAVGHDTRTGWPTEQRQIFIAGHRNTEFGVLQYLQPGDKVEVALPYGYFFYQVTGYEIVPETQMDVIKPVDFFENDQLALMTCYPFTFGAGTEERYIVYAERIID